MNRQDRATTLGNQPERHTGMVPEQAVRFSAALTCLLLTATFAVSTFYGYTYWAVTLLAGFVWVNFALGAFLSPKHTCSSLLYARFVKRFVAKPRMEHIAAPRFAQLVGFVFLALAMLGILAEWFPLFLVGTFAAFTGAFINAAFNYCIACRLYRVFKHARRIPVLIADENA